MKSLMAELRPKLRSLAVFSFFMNLLFLVPAIFMLQVFDRVIPTNSTETLAVLLAGTVVALMILLLLDYVRGRLQNVIGTLIDERLSPPVVHAMVARAARPAGGGRTDGMRDVAALRSIFSSNGLVALLDAPWVIVYVLVIWAFHPVLGIGAAVAALVMFFLAWLNDRLGRSAGETLQKEGRRAAQYIEGSLRNAEVLQALGMTDKLLARWRSLKNRMAGTQAGAGRIASVFSALSRFVRQAVQIGMLALGAYLVLSQQASAGIMIATTVLLGRAVQPLEQLVASWRPLIDARAAFCRLRELSGDGDLHEAPLTLPRPEGALVAEGITFRAGHTDRPVLINVGFSLGAGEALAIIGPSAAGKSTLARLLIGIWAPATGSVRLDGADVACWQRDNLGPWVGYVPQDVELFDGSVACNIARLGEVDSAAVVAAATRANAHEMILTLAQGYDTQVGEQATRLSPGQRQRIALARALYGDPQLVVLDEPNSNLDSDGEIALAQALSALRSEGVTTVVITHRPALIAHVDKVLVLHAGRVQQFGPAKEVMKALHQQTQIVAGEKAAA